VGLLTQYFAGDKNEKNEMGADGGGKRRVYDFGGET
jgi:hypothetical protein